MVGQEGGEVDGDGAMRCSADEVRWLRDSGGASHFTPAFLVQVSFGTTIPTALVLLYVAIWFQSSVFMSRRAILRASTIYCACVKSRIVWLGFDGCVAISEVNGVLWRNRIHYRCAQSSK